ncbi:MAG: hypothetical protein WA228_13150, partial [Desulfobaccales bacterium]
MVKMETFFLGKRTLIQRAFEPEAKGEAVPNAHPLVISWDGARVGVDRNCRPDHYVLFEKIVDISIGELIAGHHHV